MKKPVILVADQVSNNHFPSMDRPRQDYEELAKKLGAVICCDNNYDRHYYNIIRKIDKRIKIDLLAAAQAIRHINEYNLILSTSEKLAIPTAALLNLKRKGTPHIVIAHKLSSGYKTKLFKLWPLQKNFHHVITVSQAQADYAVQQLHIPKNHVHSLLDKVDHKYFKPQPVTPENFVLAVGLEQRDYQTLIKATKNTRIRLVILANSRWSTYKNSLPRADNAYYVSTRLPYNQLRDLYAKSKFVVLPLENVDYAAGVNTALEAMTMGKGLIASRTPGIQEYLAHDETALTFEPRNALALRDLILHLWHNPKEQMRLGDNARQAVEERMNLEIYVNNIANIVQKATSLANIIDGMP